MLALNQTFDDTRSIKVLVVPVGNNSLFDSHFQVVSQLRKVPFYDLNRPPTSNSSSLNHFDWGMNKGNLLFDYLRYDRVLFGPGDLDNFQGSRRVLMIMGLINYPELGESASSIEEDLEYFSRRHPHILLRRLFVFNFLFETPKAGLPYPVPPAGLANDPNSLVIFPPEGKCSEGSISMVDVHLTEVMSHAAVKIITFIEKQMDLCVDARAKNTLPASLQLSTTYDDREPPLTANQGLSDQGRESYKNYPNDYSGGRSMSVSSNIMASSLVSTILNNNKVKQWKRRPAGRLHKWMGDLCMQICSPMDAVEHYTHAITECRSQGDSLWLAGALDGYASAILLLLQSGTSSIGDLEAIIGKDPKSAEEQSAQTGGAGDFDGSSSSPSLQLLAARSLKLVEERANEALSIYSRSIVYCILEVECTLRLARMHEAIPSSLYGNVSASYTIDREQKVLGYVLRAAAVPGMNAQQQIEITLEGGLIFHRMNMKRKHAMHIYQAALLCAENENFPVAHALMHYACNQCGIATSAESPACTPLSLTASRQ